jgi:hypothetical protein
MIAADIGWQVTPSIAKPQGFMRREGFGWKGITDRGKNIYFESVNPVRRGSAF